MTDSQLPESPIWFVRAEHNNVVADHFLENGMVHMGWDIGQIALSDSIHDVVRLLRAIYPYHKDRSLSTWAHEMIRFNRSMEVGDAVATYEPKYRMCHIGLLRELSIPYVDEITIRWGNDYVHRVEWLFQISKETLSEYTRKRLGIPLTLHRLSPEASAELRGRCIR